MAVDTLGFPFFTHCTRANVSDDAGLIEMLRLNIDYFKSKPLNIPKITILLDHGYHPDHLREELDLRELYRMRRQNSIFALSDSMIKRLAASSYRSQMGSI